MLVIDHVVSLVGTHHPNIPDKVLVLHPTVYLTEYVFESGFHPSIVAGPDIEISCHRVEVVLRFVVATVRICIPRNDMIHLDISSSMRMGADIVKQQLESGAYRVEPGDVVSRQIPVLMLV